jgi:hypothetical protein
MLQLRAPSQAAATTSHVPHKHPGCGTTLLHLTTELEGSPRHLLPCNRAACIRLPQPCVLDQQQHSSTLQLA